MFALPSGVMLKVNVLFVWANTTDATAKRPDKKKCLIRNIYLGLHVIF
jgi:hypothetical protein